MEGLFVIFVLATIAIGIYVAVTQMKRTQETWTLAGRRMGLKYSGGSLFQGHRLTGMNSGFKVIIDTFTKSSGKSSTTYTRYRVRYAPLGLNLRLKQQSVFSGVARFFGSQDIEVGDEAFDRDIVVQGSADRHVREFLTPVRRLSVHRLMQSYNDCVIADREIRLVFRGLESNVGRMMAVVRRLVDVARHLTEDDPEWTYEGALSEQREGRLEEALKEVQSAPAPRRERPLDTRVLEGEILVAGGRENEAREVFAELADDVPEDPEVAGWMKQLGIPLPVSPEDVPPPPPTTATTTATDVRNLDAANPPVALTDDSSSSANPSSDASTSVASTPSDSSKDDAKEPVHDAGEDLTASDAPSADEAVDMPETAATTPVTAADESARTEQPPASREPVQAPPVDAGPAGEPAPPAIEVAERLFDPSNLSFDTTRMFDEEFKGRSVEWEGVLQRVDGFYSDMVFGSGPGAKAIVQVHNIGNDLYGGRKVQAVVQIDNELRDALQEQSGQTVQIRGTLVRCDPLMRNLFVADGEVTASAP